MKESYSEGVASHTDPESCVGLPRGGGEALTGARAGRVWSREIYETPRCRPHAHGGKATPSASLSRDAPGPGAVKDPEHVRKHLAREPGDPTTAWRREESSGRVGKSKDSSR